MKYKLNLPSKIVLLIVSGIFTASVFTLLFDKVAAEKVLYPIYSYTDEWKRDYVKNEEESAALEIYILNRDLNHLKNLEARGFDTLEMQKNILIQIARIESKIPFILSDEKLEKIFDELIASQNVSFDKLEFHKYINLIQSLEDSKNSIKRMQVEDKSEENTEKTINQNGQRNSDGHNNAPDHSEPGNNQTGIPPQVNPGGNGNSKKKDK